MPSAHSRLAPSKSAVWSVCHAAIPFTEANEPRLPPDVSTAYADEGTRAHAAATALLLDSNAVPAFDNDEMAEHVGDFVDLVKGQREPGDALHVARKVSLFYLPSQKGELDVALVQRDGSQIKRIIVDDLKYGQGVGVYAKDNTQLAIYAESLVQEIEMVEEVPADALVVLVIHQPRDRNDPEPTRLWAISRKELGGLCEGIATSAAAILKARPAAPYDKSKPDAEEHARILQHIESQGLHFKVGPHCDKGFCRARGICPHYATQGLEVVPIEPSAPEVTLPAPVSLTREQRVRIIKARKVLEAWLEAIEDQEVAELLAGAPRVGLKLVEGKTNRVWADELAAEKLLRNYLPAEQVRPPGDVISPAAAEKLLKKVETSTKFENKFAALISKPRGKPTIADENDKRQPYVANLTEGLTDVSGDDCI